MDYAKLGRTELKVSRLSLGAMAFGSRQWRPWILEERESRPILRGALDHGINFYDTSDFYSLGVSEELLGRVLLQYAPRDELVIATKVGNPMGKGPNNRGFSRKYLIQAVDASLRRLGTDYIDLYQTHVWDPSTNLQEMVEAFHALVAAGKVRYVGATTMPAWQFAKSLYLARLGSMHGFVAMQGHYNLVHREEERELIPLCRDEGIALIPYSPLARGFLCGQRVPAGGPTLRARTDEYTHQWYGRKADFRVAERVERIATRRGLSPAQVALAWVYSKPGMTSPIIGATEPEHVDQAVIAMDVSLSAAELRSLEAAYEPKPL